MKNLIVIGASGFGLECRWLAELMGEWRFFGYADDNPNTNSLGPIETIKVPDDQIFYALGIGDNGDRAQLAIRAAKRGWNPATLIHPSAVIAADAVIGSGCYIGAGAVVCPQACLGDHALVNTHASIGHHAILGDFAQVCPGARVNGHCKLGDRAFIGSNASLQPGVKIGDDATVGANSHVVLSVSRGRTVVGNPAVSVPTLRAAEPQRSA